MVWEGLGSTLVSGGTGADEDEPVSDDEDELVSVDEDEPVSVDEDEPVSDDEDQAGCSVIDEPNASCILLDPDISLLGDISEIDISNQEDDYNNLETLVLTTQEEFDSFINQISVQTGWSDQESFLQTLEDEAIDFTVDNLLIYQLTAPANTNLLTANTDIIDGKVTLVINDNVEVLVLGTPSYVFAYKIDKSLTEIAVDYNDTQTNLVIDELAEDTNILTNISQIGPLSEVSGFTNFENYLLLTSQDEYDAFINIIIDENIYSSNESFLQSLEERATDFTEKNMLIYFFEESSGSNVMTANAPELIDDKVTVILDRYVPEIGTDDVVSYGIAYELEKEIDEVIFDFEDVSNDVNEIEIPF